MAKNKHLKTIESRIGNNYYLTYVDSNVMFVQEAKGLPIMAQIICPNETPSQVLVSVAVSYSNAPAIAQLIFDLMYILSISIAEPFYEARNGELRYGQLAYETEDLETNAEFLISLPVHNEYPI